MQKLLNNTSIDKDIVRSQISASGLANVGKSSIRELVRLVNNIEQATQQTFIRMEMGVPGIPTPQIAIDAEIAALEAGVSSKYPMLEGIPELKQEISKFCLNYLNTQVSPQNCLPTVGSMQGSFAAFMVANRTQKETGGTLFLDPGFPVQKKQLATLGQRYGTFDVYSYRGEKLREKLEQQLQSGHYTSILYSNPNNPAWICFTEPELQIIGELANKYDVIVIEDLAYFGMDFRQDYSKPGQAPYQPTVARYTDNYIYLISSSKAFSYAGQRVGCLVVSDTLANRHYPALEQYYQHDNFAYCMVYGALYALSSGTSHSAQYGLTAMLKAANNGTLDFLASVSCYGSRAKIMKNIFVENGFRLVYDMDGEQPLADGFYFTFAYGRLTGEQLLESLLYYGISAIALSTTGSTRHEGLRACVSHVSDDQLPLLEQRLQLFHREMQHTKALA